MNKVALLSDGYENWVFLHKSVMEYYAASFVKKSNENFVIKFYKYVIRYTTSWLEVLTFLKYIDEYRFNKYYLLPELKEVFDEFCFLENGRDIQKLIDYLEENNFVFVINLKLQNVGAPVISLGPGRVRFCNSNIIRDPFINLFISIVRNKIEVIDDELFAFLKTSSSPTQGVSINLRQVVRLYGGDQFFTDFQIMIEKMKRKERAALESIRIHESRCKFLED